MPTKVQVSGQLVQYVKALAPEPRKALTRAIKGLATDKGDIRTLEGKLQGFSRLRVSGHRVIFTERYSSDQRIIDCVYAEKRSVVHDLFLRLSAEEAGS